VGARLAEQHAKQGASSGGGPSRDDRLPQLANRLAEIYREYIGKEPTHDRNALEAGKAGSLFDQLVDATYLAFLPENETPKWSARNRAIAVYFETISDAD
jgi:hypothetical protein